MSVSGVKDYRLRWGGPADYDKLGHVMFDAVRRGHSLYDEDQRSAWTAEPRRGKSWEKRLSGQLIILGEYDDIIAGFMTLTAKDYIDFAYIRPDFRARGLFRRLYQKLENRAFARGAKRISTHASLMARPAFTAMGFAVLKPEVVEISGAKLERFAMEKKL